MPHHKSNVKRMRQNPIRAARNKSARAAFRTALKKVELDVQEGSAEKAAAALKVALKVIGKTDKKGLIHRNKAARHASRLQKKVNALSAKAGAGEPAAAKE